MSTVNAMEKGMPGYEGGYYREWFCPTRGYRWQREIEKFLGVLGNGNQGIGKLRISRRPSNLSAFFDAASIVRDSHMHD